MAPGHKHLVRQLAKLALGVDQAPSLEAWRRFLERVERTYEDIDLERYTLERSVSLFEREMSELNERLESEREAMWMILEAAPVGIVRRDPDGNASLVNPAFCRMLGRQPHELCGSRLEAVVHPEDRAAMEATLEASLRGETPVGTLRRRLVHADGSVIHANVALDAATGEDGKPLFLIEVIADVSKQIQLEIELRHAQKLESVGMLAAGVAHEINTPIQFIGDNVVFLRDSFSDVLTVASMYRELFGRMGDAVPLEGRHAIRSTEEAADLDFIIERAGDAFAAATDGIERVAKIVRAMKAFAHPDTGERTPSDINAALVNTITVANNELRYVAEVVTQLGDLPLVPCYPSDLNQVFLNLLVNAAHAIADAKLGRRGLIRVTTSVDHSAAVVAISDTGTGIPEAIRHRIFDPFFTTKEVGRGTGQGLALARAIVVEKHGGTLTFETEVGRGTTFVARLPLRAAA